LGLVDSNSLARTLDAVNAAFFFGEPPSASQREQAARWIAGRQGLPGSYARTFAPTERDLKGGAKMFTGEAIDSRVATRHMLGEEACRALFLLDVREEEVQDALNRARSQLFSWIGKTDSRPGIFCCGKCTVSLWRHMAVAGDTEAQDMLVKGVRALKSRRVDGGRWQAFPFYYTLLALTDMQFPEATEEMKHAAQACERYLQRQKGKDETGRRRRVLAEKVLGKC